MIDENIRDGDVVLVKQQNVAEKKKGTILSLHDYKTRLKSFLKKQQRIELRTNKKNIGKKKIFCLPTKRGF